MRWLLIVLMGLAAVQGVGAADCLEVGDSNLEEIDSGYGTTLLEWSAEVRNHCDTPYDGTLTIRFLGEDEEVLHEVPEIIILQQNARQQTSKQITLPNENYKALDRIEVDIRERERPG